MILVSACLLGLDTKYDGKSNANELIIRYGCRGKYIPVCPEQLGGLPTPRLPVEIIGGTGDTVLECKAKVLENSGREVTCQFKAGAEQILKIVSTVPISAAILKERSPSCGVNQIYDGTFSHIVKQGRGITAAALKKTGIKLVSEEELTEERLLQLLADD
ncbi:MAG: DUF523 domain-containing protein [Veillonellaceae bacterium]|jgi:uncharacterized protein YbbK (DUF523 family)|nr:DUF523 domain-containing protein [Veillonellaceae bacterium]